MLEKEKYRRTDAFGNVMGVGERYDEKNNRYVFQNMTDGKRISITAKTFRELRQKERQEFPALNIRTTPFDDCTTECLSTVHEVLRDYSKKATVIMEEEVKTYKEFISFFESELPEVYKSLMKEYRKRRFGNE